MLKIDEEISSVKPIHPLCSAVTWLDFESKSREFNPLLVLHIFCSLGKNSVTKNGYGFYSYRRASTGLAVAVLNA